MRLATLFATGDIAGSQPTTATAALAAQVPEVESKLFDANKSRVLDGLIGVPDVVAKFRDLLLDRRGDVRADLVPVTPRA
jgi:hypothetical protein